MNLLCDNNNSDVLFVDDCDVRNESMNNTDIDDADSDLIYILVDCDDNNLIVGNEFKIFGFQNRWSMVQIASQRVLVV